MGIFDFFQQIIGLVQIFLRRLSPWGSEPSLFPEDRKTHDFPYIQHLRCAASTALALPMPPPNCPPLLRCCRAASAALPTLPPRIQRCRPTATAVNMLPLPPPLYRCRCCRPVTLLPHCSSPPLLRCRCRPRAANTSAALPAAAALPPLLCQHCHRAPAANTTLQMPSLVQHDLFHHLCHLVPSPF
jgi:hypothetical protein